jgi:broad specificity phosphatase PhoE
MLLARDRHFNINPYYRPAFNKVDVNEDETGYYQRSRILIDAITNAYKNRGGTILLSGHAGSIEALTRGMLQRHARPESLRFYADKVNYCNFAILDRDARSGEWSVHLPVTNENPYGGQRILQTSVPLYSASSQYILKDHIPGRRSLYGTNPYGNKSFRY